LQGVLYTNRFCIPRKSGAVTSISKCITTFEKKSYYALSQGGAGYPAADSATKMRGLGNPLKTGKDESFRAGWINTVLKIGRMGQNKTGTKGQKQAEDFTQK